MQQLWQTAAQHSGLLLRRFPWIGLLNLLLAASLGYQAVALGLRTGRPAGLPHSVPNPPTSPADSQLPGDASAPALNLAPVLQARLFGRAASTAAQPSAPLIAPETTLNLSLQGTLFSDDKDYAKAVVASAGGKAQEYKIGQNLPGGARLQDIHANQVILLRNSQYETLRLIGKKDSTNLTTTPPLTQAVTLPSSNREVGEKLTAYRRQILEKPALMGQLIRITSVEEQGQFKGYRLAPGSDSGLFEAAGLQRGDILTQLNGTRLDSPVQGLNALQNLVSAQQLQLEVLRDGVPLSFSFQLP